MEIHSETNLSLFSANATSIVNHSKLSTLEFLRNVLGEIEARTGQAVQGSLSIPLKMIDPDIVGPEGIFVEKGYRDTYADVLGTLNHYSSRITLIPNDFLPLGTAIMMTKDSMIILKGLAHE